MAMSFPPPPDFYEIYKEYPQVAFVPKTRQSQYAQAALNEILRDELIFVVEDNDPPLTMSDINVILDAFNQFLKLRHAGGAITRLPRAVLDPPCIGCTATHML